MRCWREQLKLERDDSLEHFMHKSLIVFNAMYNVMCGVGCGCVGARDLVHINTMCISASLGKEWLDNNHFLYVRKES